MYGNGAAQGYASTKAQDVSIGRPLGQVSALRLANDRFANAIKQVEELTAKARNIADGVFGGEPTGSVGPEYAQSDTIGHLHDLSRNADALDNALSALTYQINRFQTL